MKIVIVGGTGLIGSQLLKMLHAHGHEVVSASPKAGVNALTGEGLATAMAGTDVVVDVSNSPTFEDSVVLEFFQTSGRNLLAAEKLAGVKHHIVLSVVGTDRFAGSGYFRGKLAQETVIKTGGLPFTILRATQFFEFMGSIAPPRMNDEPVRLSPAMMQPVASAEVAATLAEIAVAQPINRTVEFAGPEKFRLADIVGKAMAAKGDSRKIIVVEQATYYGMFLETQSLMPGMHAKLGTLRFDQWLGDQSR